MADYTPVNSDNFAVTQVASGAIVGGQLVSGTGSDGQVKAAVAGDRAIGVAAHDAPSGQPVTVIVLPGQYHELVIKNGVTISAGAAVIVGSSGGGSNAGFADTAALATAAAAGTLIGICVRGGVGNTSNFLSVLSTSVKARVLCV